MRLPLALAAALAATPAQAWEFSPSPICTLTAESEAAFVTVTYSPAVGTYAITLIRRQGPWRDGPVFAIRFDGPRGLTISTTRHRLSDGNIALVVTDTGFGNVLNGLQFNNTATASLADQRLTIPLEGAAPPVEEFRACTRDAAA